MNMEQSIITTSRLTLRPFTAADSADVKELIGNLNVSKTLANIPHPYNDQLAREWIACHQLQWYQKITVNFAIVYSATDELIGSISLMDIARSEASIGYWIGEPFWNMGFCSEASTAVIRFAFKTMGLHKLTGNHVSHNQTSGKVMRKVGMKYVGHTQETRLNGSAYRVEHYEIQRSNRI